MTTPFQLSVTVTESRLVVASGMYLAPVHTWERCVGLTAGQLLARWDDVYSWIPPDERDGCINDHWSEADAFRREFVALPHIAQAAIVAEWEGDPWPTGPLPIGRAVRDEVHAILDRHEDAD